MKLSHFGGREAYWLSLGVGVLIELKDWSAVILDYEDNFLGRGSEHYSAIRAYFRL